MCNKNVKIKLDILTLEKNKFIGQNFKTSHYDLPNNDRFYKNKIINDQILEGKILFKLSEKAEKT